MKQRQAPPIHLNRLAEQIGRFTEHWGFKKIHGMIWTHLYLSSAPLSAQELISRLNVSKALISLSVKDLLKYRLILQTEESKTKKNKFYVANPNVIEVIASVLEMRELSMITKIRSEFESLAEASDEIALVNLSSERLSVLGSMITGTESSLKTLIGLPHLDPLALAIPSLDRFALK